MIHTIDAGTQAQGAILRAMFEARKRVFVDLLKWDVPVLGGSWELDGFDDAHATYIVVSDELGRHRASARLLETTRPHILGDLFPRLSDGPVPRGPAIREITRFCLERDLRASERREARNQLVSALVAHALARGIERYTGVAEMAWFQQVLSFGWHCRALGAPQIRDGAMLAALAIDIDGTTPGLLEAGGIWSGGDVLESPVPRAA
ncbi:acyl-homoserine-lactone synthase [Novosphingobium malaysiense]|uniref:Acyl-homoserine-lactone synthase n=1 Tax=Novosphingobium malaysiense TaxID=1348853 RepID=A0A0B1ZDG2_9SPHN|nr:acyl-homoserine-lactone synthase [Novosphingobium malaysiense]KHK89069.1 autoinducer synthase [Novosphingobium malaysiense]